MGSIASAIGQGVGSLVGGFMGGAGLESKFTPQQAQLIEQQNLLQQLQAAQTGSTGLTGQQQALAQALLAQSQGQGPAMDVVRQAQERANLQGAGMLASARGVNPALAARQAAQQAAAGQQAVAGGAGQLAMQSQQQLGNLYGTMGTQGLQQQQLLQNALADQNRARLENVLGTQRMAQQAEAASIGARGSVIGGLFGAAGAAMQGGGKAFGGFIDGAANVPGDSPANDTVPAMLSPGEIVIPRSAAGDADAAKAFIDHLMNGKSRKAKKGG
jgi:hypothetical protein